MGNNVTQKILNNHLVAGELSPGKPITIKIDQTLTQDATGTMAYLQFETLGISRPKVSSAVSYIDHNMLQDGFENPDDHRYLTSIAERYGIFLSRPGNGICHQVHLERFGEPGKTLVGSDSHTPTAGGLGMFAVGVGGLDVAVSMAGKPFHLTCPRVMRINLTGKLPDWVSAKDIILKVLSILSSKGNVGWVLEYGGDGINTLSVPERATLSIGEGQTISQPYIVALMTQLLDLKGGEKVLEIGTGSGYQAAVLAEIVEEVYTVEIYESLS